jgi:hypothetical protein
VSVTAASVIPLSVPFLILLSACPPLGVVQIPEVSRDLAYMSLQVPSASGAQESVKLAEPGAPHGRFAAFSAAPRVVTEVTATQKEISMRAGRRVFADE